MTGCWPCRWNVERFFGGEIENFLVGRAIGIVLIVP